MMQQHVKDEFLKIFADITREGSDKLLDYLNKSDFFIAPASTKFHSDFEGGLMHHSILVYKRLKNMVRLEYGEDYTAKVSDETLAICGLLHDLCKVDTYKIEYRNQKVNGSWESVPFYSYQETLPYGHGEKSVYILSSFIRLSREEAMAINWHMGGFDARVVGGYSKMLAAAFETYPLAVLVHNADMQASYLDEIR